jgi:hypothetical protein
VGAVSGYSSPRSLDLETVQQDPTPALGPGIKIGLALPSGMLRKGPRYSTPHVKERIRLYCYEPPLYQKRQPNPQVVLGSTVPCSPMADWEGIPPQLPVGEWEDIMGVL